MINQKYLHEILKYDPDTGIFIWKNRSNVLPWWNSKHEGKIAGSIHVKGYRYILINKKSYKAHRLAWLFVYGEWPKDQIDHINMVKDDNRIENLRNANDFQNQANRPKRSTNKSGYKGVSWSKASGKWKSQTRINGKVVGLGYFKCPEIAHLVYSEHVAKIHGEFARTS